jgi:hypothetical protein
MTGGYMGRSQFSAPAFRMTDPFRGRLDSSELKRDAKTVWFCRE